MASRLERLEDAQRVTCEALRAAFQLDVYPEALTTVASEPWSEIGRIFRTYRCESLLLGLSSLEQLKQERNLERLTEQIDTDVVILRAPPGWSLKEGLSILVPVGGRGGHDRLLGSLSRSYPGLKVTYLGVAPVPTEALSARLGRVAKDELEGRASTRVLADDRPVSEVIAEVGEQHDVILLGLQRQGRQSVFGQITLQVAELSEKALVVIGHRGS